MSRKKLIVIELCIAILIPCILVVGVYYGSESITVFSENSPIPNRKTIVIDAGHGGADGGAISCHNIHESAINLEIALRLNDLMHLLGMQTLMIRTEDISVGIQDGTIAQRKISDLKQRVKIVNATDQSLLISIHQNHFSDSRYRGTQIFYANTQGSSDLAKLMQHNFVSALQQDSNRACKKSSGVYLMDKIHTTGILIECGFLSNPEEEVLLRSENYQKQICSVIATTVSTYLSQDIIT